MLPGRCGQGDAPRAVRPRRCGPGGAARAMQPGCRCLKDLSDIRPVPWGGGPTGRNVTAHAVTLWAGGGSRQECDCDTGLRMAQRDLTQCDSQPCSQPCCQPCSQSRSKRASQPASQPAVTITSSGGRGGRARREKCDKHLRHIGGEGGVRDPR